MTTEQCVHCPPSHVPCSQLLPVCCSPEHCPTCSGSVCTLGRMDPACQGAFRIRIGVKSELHTEMGCKYRLPKQDTIWIFLLVIITVVTFLGK